MNASVAPIPVSPVIALSIIEYVRAGKESRQPNFLWIKQHVHRLPDLDELRLFTIVEHQDFPAEAQPGWWEQFSAVPKVKLSAIQHTTAPEVAKAIPTTASTTQVPMEAERGAKGSKKGKEVGEYHDYCCR